MNVCAPAKVNLTLDVVGRRPNGYHDLTMLMQEIGIYDKLSIERAQKIQVRCDREEIPNGEENLAYKAAAAFFKKAGVQGGADIYIEKQIPSGAGLGGGSSDAAAVLKGLNQLYNAQLEDAALEEAALEVGSDVPFFIKGGTQMAKGLGELLTPVPNKIACTYLIVKPAFSISTKWAYQQLDLQRLGRRPDQEAALQGLETGDLQLLAKGMANVLESAVVPHYPAIDQYKKRMQDWGAQAALMSGSGSAVFGLFEDEEQAISCKEGWQTETDIIFVTKGVVR